MNRSLPTLAIAALVIGGLAARGVVNGGASTATSRSASRAPFDVVIADNMQRMMDDGRQTFRFDTFGDEAFWSDGLGLDRAIAGEKHGGVGAGVSPKTALALGLKVDMDALPPAVVEGVKAGKVDMNDPATTLTLIKLNAVLGVVGTFDGDRMTKVGLTCAVCHSTVDDAFAPGIGHRLDGFGNRDLDPGAIIAATPNVALLARELKVDVPTVKKVLASWGPGRFDAELDKDGKAMRPDGKQAGTIIPNAFGLAGVNNHTWTGGWGDVTYWNAYVANTELHGKGVFYDRRLSDAKKYPVSARTGGWQVRNSPDLITSEARRAAALPARDPGAAAPRRLVRRRAPPRAASGCSPARRRAHLPRAAALHRAGMEHPQGERDRHRRLPVATLAGQQLSDRAAQGAVDVRQGERARRVRSRLLSRRTLQDTRGRRRPLRLAPAAPARRAGAEGSRRISEVAVGVRRKSDRGARSTSGPPDASVPDACRTRRP